MEHTNKTFRHDIVYMRIARNLASLSYAIRSKVGCIIVSQDGQIVSQGWNGMPSGMQNKCEHEEDGNLVTNKEVLHAESNAITKCAKGGYRINGATIYVTLSPCLECSKLLLQSGIKRIVYLDEYRNLEGLKLLYDNNIEINQIDLNDLVLYGIEDIFNSYTQGCTIRNKYTIISL